MDNILKTPILKIKSGSIKDEVNEIWDVLKNFNWMVKNNYNTVFPSHSDFKEIITIAKNKSLQDKVKQKVFKIINDTYDESFYQNSIDKLNSIKSEIINVFPKFVVYNNTWGFTLFEEYTIKILKYGSTGTYNPEKGIVYIPDDYINQSDICNLTIHELFHIGIEELIWEYDINHYLKERIVDLYCRNEFLLKDYCMQDFGDKSVDKLLVKNKYDLSLTLEEFSQEKKLLSQNAKTTYNKS